MNTRLASGIVGAAIAGGVIGFGLGRCSAPAPTAQTGARAAPTQEFTANVVRVGDGDTIEVSPVEPPGPNEKVRLLGIDAPALGKPGYAEGTAALRGLVAAGSVRIEFERANRGERDTSERILGYVVIDGLNANIEMVRLGWATFSDKHGGLRYAAELRAAEDEARAEKRGIWR